MLEIHGILKIKTIKTGGLSFLLGYFYLYVLYKSAHICNILKPYQNLQYKQLVSIFPERNHPSFPSMQYLPVRSKYQTKMRLEKIAIY